MNDNFLDIIFLFLINIKFNIKNTSINHIIASNEKYKKKRKLDFIEMYNKNILYDVGYYKWIKTQ